MVGFPLRDQITYWPVTYPNGQAVYAGAGILAAAAVASKREEVITEDGKEPAVSKLAVYTEAALQTDFMVAEGDFEGLPINTDDMNARRVMVLSRVPSGTTLIRVLI